MDFIASLFDLSIPKLIPQHSRLSKITHPVVELMPEHAKGKPLEVWFQDKAHVRQQETLTRKWARPGTRPLAPRDTRYKWGYIFGAACPAPGTATGLIVPYFNAEAMELHLNEIAKSVAILTRTEPHGKRLSLSAVKQTRYLGLRHLRGNPQKMCPSMELLRQRSKANNFNYQKRLGKGQLLGRLV